MRMKRSRKNWLIWLSVGLMSASGCNRYLVTTPTLLYQQDPQKYFAACPTECQTPAASVIYATDRVVTGRTEQYPIYGSGRANSLAFGVASVSLNPHPAYAGLNPPPAWQTLIQDSTRPNRQQEYELKLADTREMGRIKGNLNRLPDDGTGLDIQRVSAFQADQQQEQQFRELLSGRLAQSPQKDVYIFIHGVNNAFDDAVFRAAEVWHFMGRTGVPIAYTWPAGLGGIRGYAYDRESGEFTVTHLRHFISAVANCPGVERVHLIAHSRGTDVTISALRELHLGFTAQGRSTQHELKLENLVLAAPDVDEEVFMQRFVGENLFQAAHRTTIYASPHDKAIELADIIFASRRRLGTAVLADFGPRIKQSLSKLPNVQFIECKVTGWMLSHSYVFTHPAALSDLILVLRDRRDPGAENGRPLNQPSPGTWELTDDYLTSPLRAK